MRAPSELPWATLLLCCTAASITTSAIVVLALQQLQNAQNREKGGISNRPPHAPQRPTNGVTQEALPAHTDAPRVIEAASPSPEELLAETAEVAVAKEKPVLDLRTLPVDDVPLELRVDAYFAPEHVAAFDHSEIFRGCSNVFAVIDKIHPYLETYFRESSWVGANSQSKDVTILKTSGKRDRNGRYAGDSDDSDSDEDEDGDSVGAMAASTSRKWRLPECIDPAEVTEVVLYPGVDPRTFAAKRIINLDPNAPAFSKVGSPTRSGSSASQRPLSPSARRYSYGRSSNFEEVHDHPKPQKKHIVVFPGALILGGVFDVSEGSIFIGKHVRIEPNVYIKGPCIIGDHSTIRSGAYLRGDLIIGRRVVLRGELKNALIMDNAELCHPGYCGDSICGYKSHFGNQVTTANLNLFYNTAYNEILVDLADARYNTGRKKIGVVLGDYSQLGCSSVTDPCTLLRPNTVVYTLTRLRKGIYGPNVIIKNKPLEKGVLEIAPLRLPPVKEPVVVVEEEKIGGIDR